MSNYDQPYFARLDALKAAGIDPHGNDDTVFGVSFVYCHAHLRSHGTGWCTVSAVDKTPLTATTETEATAEARNMGFYIYGDPRPCTNGCGTDLDLNGRPVGVAFDEVTPCPKAPTFRGANKAHRVR